MRMSRLNITVPDHIVVRSKAAGLNVSRLATAALVEELDRLDKIDALDAYLDELDRQLGPIPTDERSAAVAWVDELSAPRPVAPAGPRRRRSG